MLFHSRDETIPDIRNMCINFTDEISGRKEPTDCYDIYQRCFMCTSYAELHMIVIRKWMVRKQPDSSRQLISRQWGKPL